MTDLSKVNRVEVIDGYGRSYTSYNADEVSITLQDDGRTLKVMHTGDTSHGMTSEQFDQAVQDIRTSEARFAQRIKEQRND